MAPPTMKRFARVIQAVLVSPQFLFRLELNASSPASTPRPLDDYELAARLSYFLWSSMPDDELFRAASAKELGDSTNLSAQVARMVAIPKPRPWSTTSAQNGSTRGTSRTCSPTRRSTLRSTTICALRWPRDHVSFRRHREGNHSGRRAPHVELQLHERPAREALRPSRGWVRDAGSNRSPEPARRAAHPCQHAHGQRTPQGDRTGLAGQMDPEPAPLHRHSASAPRYSEGAGGDGKPVAAPAVGRASPELGLLVLSLPHGSAGSRARTVRCGGSVSHDRQRRGDRHLGPAPRTERLSRDRGISGR